VAIVGVMPEESRTRPTGCRWTSCFADSLCQRWT